MPRPEKGTPSKLALWLSRCRLEPTDRVVIVCAASGAEYDVAEYTKDSIGEGWHDEAFALMQATANERGATTAFYVRHVRGDQVRATFEVRCRSEGGDEASDFDGSAHSLVQGVYKQNAKLLDHSLAQTNAVLAPMMKTLEFATGRVTALEEQAKQLAEENHELRQQIFTMTRELQQAAASTEERWAEKIEQLAGLAQAWMESQKNQNGRRTNGGRNVD